ncbi:MAG: hypothetical protein ACOC1G_04890 [Phycisphaeraceae bacterium]
MSWFQRLCRNSGLMVHHIGKSVKSKPGKGERHEVRRDVEESHPEPGVTLRRTTIEEIEYHADKDQNP